MTAPRLDIAETPTLTSPESCGASSPSTAEHAHPFTRLRILKDVARYSTSALLAQAVGLISGFWVARFLAPAEFGIWNAVSLVLVYGAQTDFGLLEALGRDLPYHRGKSDARTAEALEGATKIGTLGGAALAAAAVLAASFFVDAPAIRTGLRLTSVALVFQQAYTYHRMLLRADNRFSEIARQQLIHAVTTAVLVVPAVMLMGLLGRMLTAVVSTAGIFWYAVHRDPWRRTQIPSVAVVIAFVKVGFPIRLSTMLMSLVNSVDRPIVIAFLGETQLGYFGLALLLSSIISLVPTMAAQVLYPRLTHQFGSSGHDVSSLRPFVVKPPLVLACILPFLIGPMCILLPVVVTLALPAYQPAVSAIRLVVIGGFFLATVGVTDYFLLAIGKVRHYALFAAGALALNLTLDYVALRLGYGIVGIAIAGTGLTYFVYSTAVIGYVVSHFITKARERVRYFLGLWLPFGYMLLLLWAVEHFVQPLIPASTRFDIALAGGAQILVYVVGAAPLAWVASKRVKPDAATLFSEA